MREVEAEFGEPFWDVVRGFAADGYACDTTARILGYQSPRQFRSLIKRHQVEIAWPALGSCNVHRERGPLSEATKAKIRDKALARHRSTSAS
ncbi:CRISPR repeat binding protein [Pseudomonas phage Dolphis]|nr:CRISPR repeat binding protein [Pseudomonas phage Dolphis]